MSAAGLDVACYRDFATRVLAELGRISRCRPAPDSAGQDGKDGKDGQAGLDSLVTGAARQAGRLRRLADEPIKIGVVGEYSVGKSMLLGTLLGNPQLLPVEEQATTGNVTALRVSQAPPGVPTRLEHASVEYLSSAQLAECVGYILTELRGEIVRDGAGMDAGPLARLDPVSDGWEAFEHWCRTALWSDSRANPVFRRTALELLRIRDAHLAGSRLLDRSFGLGVGLLRDGLELDKPEVTPSAFPERPYPYHYEPDHGLSREVLRRTFPLVRRVNYEVSVAAETWRLDDLVGDNQLVMLDFPGLSSGASSKRDEFLSRRELAEVQTIVTVVDATRPQAEVPLTFYTMLQSHGRDEHELRDAVLVAGNLFDLVTAPAVPPADGGALTVEEVVSASQRLHGLRVAATDLTGGRPDRLVLHSSMVAVGAYQLPYDPHSPEGLKIEQAVPTALAQAEAWRAVAARLRRSDGAPLSQADAQLMTTLKEFSTDGGAGALRRLVENHVRKHGLSLKTAALRRESVPLRTSLADIAAHLEVLHDQTRASTDGGRHELLDLLRDLDVVMRALTADVGLLRDPSRLHLPDGRSLLGATHSAAVAEVYSWSAWDAVLRRADAEALLPKNAPRDSFATSRFASRFGGNTANSGGVSSTTELMADFQRTVMVVTSRGDDELLYSLQATISRMDGRLAPLRARLADPDIRAQVVQYVSAEGMPGGPLETLTQATSLSWMIDDVQHLVTSLPPPRYEEIARRFPLMADHAFPWHPDAPSPSHPEAAKAGRHPVRLMRVRRELANAVSDTAQERIARILGDVVAYLDETMHMLHGILPSGSRIRVPQPSEPQPDDSAPSGTEIRRLLDEWNCD